MGSLDVLENLPGCPGPLGGVQKVSRLAKGCFYPRAPAFSTFLLLGLWKREAATGPESRNHLSDPKETEKRLFPLFSSFYKETPK